MFILLAKNCSKKSYVVRKNKEQNGKKNESVALVSASLLTAFARFLKCISVLKS